jgi:pimeloyl-ACP methyl ester carboxylesterase
MNIEIEQLLTQKEITMTTPWADGSVQANGLTIHYYRDQPTTQATNHKPTIVFLHGIIDSGLCWSRVAHAFAEHYHVVMLDARGHGLSSGIESGFSLDLLAEDAADAIRALELEKPILIGHSMGAVTAALLATKYPDLPSALVLIDPPLMDETMAAADKKRPNKGELPPWAQQIIELRMLTPDERLAKARVLNPHYPDEENIPWAESKTQFQLEVFQKFSIFGYPWQSLAPHLTLPTLLLIGDPAQHPAVSPTLAQKVASAWSHCQVVQIDGAGHSIQRDKFEETIQTIQVFLNS